MVEVKEVIFVVVVLSGMEPRTPCMLGEHSTSCSTSPALF